MPPQEIQILEAIKEQSRASEQFPSRLVPELLEGLSMLSEQVADLVGSDIEKYLNWQSTTLNQPFSGYSSTIDHQIQLATRNIAGLRTGEQTVLEQAFTQQVGRNIRHIIAAKGRFVEVRLEGILLVDEIRFVEGAPAGFQSILDERLSMSGPGLMDLGLDPQAATFLRSIRDTSPDKYRYLTEDLMTAVEDQREGIFIDRDMIFTKGQ